MNQHPIRTMLSVWGLCVAGYVFLPFQLLERELTVYGTVVLVLFISAFVVGTLLMPRRTSGLVLEGRTVDATRAEAWLMLASALATVFFFFDAKGKNLFDLAVAYQLRSESADALLKGAASSSSAWFQMAFLLYPAGYVYTAVHSLYAPRVRAWKLLLFGFLPVVLATLVMGGRVPIFYAAIVAWLALRERKKLGHAGQLVAKEAYRHRWKVKVVWLVVAVALFYYFSTVFMVRAAVAGGPAEMFVLAEQRWGVGFRGPMSGILFAIFGEELTYLIFIFSWYLVQGFVISNYLFSAYEGPWQLGIYGADIISALMRRFDPERVAEGFGELLNLGTYGFLPSAWGSLYVDFGFWGLLFCVLWGAFSALCYRRIVVQQRTDWLLLGPFVTMGMIFSTMNTPLGFTNGLVTYGWLLLAFLLLKHVRQPAVVVA